MSAKQTRVGGKKNNPCPHVNKRQQVGNCGSDNHRQWYSAPIDGDFKGKPNGRIAKTEFAMYPAPHHYRCQENAWMDKVVMIAWVDKILLPYIEMAQDDNVPLLILDSYRCHMMGLVDQKIQVHWVEVKHIPGGCTSLCQPINITLISHTRTASGGYGYHG
jgi:hypothetical protein